MQAKSPRNDIANCLLPLLDALGWRGDKMLLEEAMPHLPEAMSISDLLNTLANLKFEGRMFDSRLNAIDDRAAPYLFVPDGSKAALVVVAVGTEMLLAFNGLTKEFCQIKRDRQKGKAILFNTIDKTTPNLQKQQPDWFNKVLLRFRQLIRHAVAISLLISVLTFISPLFVGFIYNGVLTSGSAESLRYLGFGMLFFVLADAGFRFLRSYLFLYISNRLGNIIGNEVFRRLLYLPPAYTENANVGAQVARIKDFETVREFFGGQALIALFELPFVVLLIVVLTFIGGRVALVPICSIALFVVFGLSIMPAVKRNNQLVSQTGSDKQSFVLEMLTNMRTIRCSGAIANWMTRYRKISALAAWNNYSMAKLNALITAFSYWLVTLSGLGTLTLGVHDVISGSMTQGALVASMMLVWRILAPLGTGFGVLTQIGRISRSINQVDNLMNMNLESQQEANLTATRQFNGKITFADVSIRYQPDAPAALLNVSFNVEPGQVLALVGHDGAGKSTILKLILSLYTPQVGRVLLDNINIRQIDSLLLRRSIGYAPKENFYFYGSIEQNIKFGNSTATDNEFGQALLRVEGFAEEADAMPEGFDTRIKVDTIGEFSASFLKRLCLTRAFLRKSKILLLDEPETGLSAGEVLRLRDSLANLREDYTIILATHDSNLFSIADKMLWLENGRVKGFGNAIEIAQKYQG